MSWSDEKLKELEDLAGLLFTPDEIAIIMEIEDSIYPVQVKFSNNPIGKAFARGRLKTIAEHRADVKRLSNLGSSPAQTLLQKLIDDSKLEL